MRSTSSISLLLSVSMSLAAAVAAPAFASDGLLEINQACAVHSGCFAGDEPGFPVTISASGSYRLTSNLDYPSSLSQAISILSFDVVIDLNGHTVKGTNSCAAGSGGWIISCSQTNGFGAIIGSGAVRVRVMNGRILGAGSDGINLADAAEIRDIQVSDCSDEGIAVGSRSIVASVSAIGNRGNGIESISGSTLVRDSVATNNGVNGITIGSGSTVSGNTTSTNAIHGISAASGSSVSGNTAQANGSHGLSLGSTTSYRNNTITGNALGTLVNALGVNVGGNVCNGTLGCP